MEECEVEILEPQNNWEKEIPALAEIVTTQIPVQRIIVNNQEQVIMGEATALICPKCRTIIQQFQPGIPAIEIHQSLCTEDEQALNHTIYCQKCGQKLKILRPMPIEVEYDIQEVND